MSNKVAITIGSMLGLLLLLIACMLTVTVSTGSRSGSGSSSSWPRVSRVADGDTIELDNGKRVRLVQIDAPELEGECYGFESAAVLQRLLPKGTRVRLARDPRLDNVDRYARFLRYVFKGKTNVNIALVRKGAASVWFYGGVKGRYAHELLTVAKTAHAQKRGLWGACTAVLDPYQALQSQYK